MRSLGGDPRLEGRRARTVAGAGLAVSRSVSRTTPTVRFALGLFDLCCASPARALDPTVVAGREPAPRRHEGLRWIREPPAPSCSSSRCVRHDRRRAGLPVARFAALLAVGAAAVNVRLGHPEAYHCRRASSALFLRAPRRRRRDRSLVVAADVLPRVPRSPRHRSPLDGGGRDQPACRAASAGFCFVFSERSAARHGDRRRGVHCRPRSPRRRRRWSRSTPSRSRRSSSPPSWFAVVAWWWRSYEEIVLERGSPSYLTGILLGLVPSGCWWARADEPNDPRGAPEQEVRASAAAVFGRFDLMLVVDPADPVGRALIRRAREDLLDPPTASTPGRCSRPATRPAPSTSPTGSRFPELPAASACGGSSSRRRPTCGRSVARSRRPTTQRRSGDRLLRPDPLRPELQRAPRRVA